MPAPAPTIQLKRGLFVNLPGLRAGEPGFTTDKSDLYIGIGGTAGDNKFFGSSRYWERENGSHSAVLKLVNPSDTGSINIKSPDSHTGVTTYTLPSTAPGGTGHFLSADANGILSWESVSASATFSDSTLTGITTITYIDGTDADFSGIVTSTSYHVGSIGSGTTVLSINEYGVVLSGISTIDATTKAALEQVLSLDPNDFHSLYVSGIGTFTGQLYAQGGLNVTGLTELENLSVTGVATFTNAINADLNGNASSADTLNTGRNIAVSGIVTGTAYFDGSQSIDIVTTLQNDVVGLGTHTYGDYVKTITAGNGLSGDATGEGSTPTLEVNVGAGITISSDNVAFRNAGALTDNYLQKWDDTNEQLVNSIISDTGSIATIGGGLVITGDLTVNGTTTQVNTTELTVYDRTITLGIQTGTTPDNTSWDLGILMNYGEAGTAKTAGVIWEYSAKRFQFAANSDNPAVVGIDTTAPSISVSSFAPIEIGSLWINNSCAGGSPVEVIGCNQANNELHLKNIVVDGGSFV